MSKTITLSISASSPESDAPTVKDFLDQVRDYFELMSAVEQTIADEDVSAIEWRIIDASKNSPLRIAVQAFSRQHAVNVDRRAALVLEHAACGLRTLQREAVRPTGFNDQALDRANRIFERVTNGLGLTTFDFGDTEPIIFTPSVARSSVRHVRQVLAPKGRPYRELGSLEGNVRKVELDGHGRRVLIISHRLTGDEVKCFVAGDAERELAIHEIGEVWKNRRVEVFGVIHYRAIGRIQRVDATLVRFLRSRSELPDAASIIDPNFAGGLPVEEYLSELHNGQ